MSAISEETTIRREPADWLPVELPGTEGISIKVYHVDRVNHNVVVRFRFAPGGYGARHVHHCRAIGYTISGEWAYDEGSFEEGDVAYELIGNNHYPFSKNGGELIVIMEADEDLYLDNYLEDGTILHLGERFFEAMCGLSLEDYRKLTQEDLLALVDVVPEPRDPGKN